eukprot:scaffold1557_cov189-Alexandrium_tamarense.AAC.3
MDQACGVLQWKQHRKCLAMPPRLLCHHLCTPTSLQPRLVIGAQVKAVVKGVPSVKVRVCLLERSYSFAKASS